MFSLRKTAALCTNSLRHSCLPSTATATTRALASTPQRQLRQYSQCPTRRHMLYQGLVCSRRAVHHSPLLQQEVSQEQGGADIDDDDDEEEEEEEEEEKGGDVVALDSAGSSSSSAPPSSWQWVPPRARSNEGEKDLEDILPVVKGAYLTVAEVTLLLEHFKGENIINVPIGKEKMLDGIEHFVLVSGDSTRHLRRMADALLKQVRRRRLLKAAAFKNGVEGDKVDDWLVVDCHNCVVHLMMPAMRKSLDLESHWGSKVRPFAKYEGSEKAFESSLDKLFNQYPPPPDTPHHYDPNSSDREGGRDRDRDRAGGATTFIRLPSSSPQHDY